MLSRSPDPVPDFDLRWGGEDTSVITLGVGVFSGTARASQDLILVPERGLPRMWGLQWLGSLVRPSADSNIRAFIELYPGVGQVVQRFPLEMFFSGPIGEEISQGTHIFPGKAVRARYTWTVTRTFAPAEETFRMTASLLVAPFFTFNESERNKLGDYGR